MKQTSICRRDILDVAEALKSLSKMKSKEKMEDDYDSQACVYEFWQSA